MTDRYNAFVVVLEEDVRSDDAESILSAIRHIRGVLDVTPNVASIDSIASDSRARTDIAKKLWSVLYPKGNPRGEGR